MKKIFALLALVGGLTLNSFAQSSSDGGKFSIGAEAGLPLGTAGDIYSAVIGGSVKYAHPVATNTFLTLSAGYNSFLVKSDWKPFIGSSHGAIPVKAGAKYYFSPGFFGEGQLGAAFSTESGGGTAFVYSPGIGYTFGSGFEAGVRYEGWSNDGTISQLGLRVGFNF